MSTLSLPLVTRVLGLGPLPPEPHGICHSSSRPEGLPDRGDVVRVFLRTVPSVSDPCPEWTPPGTASVRRGMTHVDPAGGGRPIGRGVSCDNRKSLPMAGQRPGSHFHPGVTGTSDTDCRRSGLRNGPDRRQSDRAGVTCDPTTPGSGARLRAAWATGGAGCKRSAVPLQRRPPVRGISTLATEPPTGGLAARTGRLEGRHSRSDPAPGLPRFVLQARRCGDVQSIDPCPGDRSWGILRNPMTVVRDGSA
jgi:hypothetical protein